MQTPLFRIKPAETRSVLALASQAAYKWIDVSAIAAARPDRRAREIAASLAHARALEAFLDTLAPFGVVIEDDAILAPNTSWMLLAGYDFFVPFGHNRKTLPRDTVIKVGCVPRSGAFAYVASRRFALSCLPRLHAGEVADKAMRRAADGMRIASYRGNLVNHDNHSPSMISEARRLKFLRGK